MEKKIIEQNNSFYLGNLDMNSLFNKILLGKTVTICTESIYNQNNSVQVLNRSELKELLSLAIKESYFIFNTFLYKQEDGVTIGSP